MLFTFAIFDKRLDIIVVQTGSLPHVNGNYIDPASLKPRFDTKKCNTQQIIHRIAKRCPS
jgi:hypothetical protein